MLFAILFVWIVILVLNPSAHAQQLKRSSRIGVIGLETRSMDGLRQGFSDLGYDEGKNLQIVYRNVEGKTDQMPQLVQEMVQLKVDVLIVNNPTLIHAAQRTTQTIPIVMVTNQDPVAAKIVASLARPGGNVTGIASLTRDLSGKRLELLKQAAPRTSRIGVLWVAATSLGTGSAFHNYEDAARGLKIELKSIQMHRPNPDLESAFGDATMSRVNALIAVTNAVINPYAKMIANFAIQNRLPLMVERSKSVDEGALVSYATNDAEIYRRAAFFVDKILKGAKPAELPVEQPTKFELVINLKTAKQIGLTIPPNVLARADRVIK